MPRDLPIGNGTLLAAFDSDYQLRDFYYPRVGKENHAQGFPWRFGVWLDGEFLWFGQGGWSLRLDYVADALVTEVMAVHPRLPLRLSFNDTIDYEKNILVRRVRVENLSGRPLVPRLFFHADINALENEIGAANERAALSGERFQCGLAVGFKGSYAWLTSLSAQREESPASENEEDNALDPAFHA